MDVKMERRQVQQRRRERAPQEDEDPGHADACVDPGTLQPAQQRERKRAPVERAQERSGGRDADGPRERVICVAAEPEELQSGQQDERGSEQEHAAHEQAHLTTQFGGGHLAHA
jgi:hypothetical protein